MKNNVFELSHGIKSVDRITLIINVHTGENALCKCYMCIFVSRFFSDKVKKLEVYFRLNESSLEFWRKKYQINAQ